MNSSENPPINVHSTQGLTPQERVFSPVPAKAGPSPPQWCGHSAFGLENRPSRVLSRFLDFPTHASGLRLRRVHFGNLPFFRRNQVMLLPPLVRKQVRHRDGKRGFRELQYRWPGASPVRTFSTTVVNHAVHLRRSRSRWLLVLRKNFPFSYPKTGFIRPP